jgi:hypothetical protein
MRKLILTYLTKHYKLDKLQDKHIGIYQITNPDEFVYGSELISELETIFSIDEKRIKDLVKQWAGGNKLAFYWDYKKLFFPSVRSVVASLMANDLVAVQPMAGPVGRLMHLDYTYSADTTPNENGRVFLDTPIGELNHVNRGSIIGVSSRMRDDNLEV